LFTTRQNFELAGSEGKPLRTVITANATYLRQERDGAAFPFILGALQVSYGGPKIRAGLVITTRSKRSCAVFQEQCHFVSPSVLAHRISVTESRQARTTLRYQGVVLG
jgi:hypothetical protein